MNEKHVDLAIRRALSHGTQARADCCPDQNLVAAYLEHRLGPAENEALEVHASECASCRSLLAMAMIIDEEPAPERARPAPGSSRILFRISIPVSAVALIAVAVAAGILFLRTPKQPGVATQPTQTAELRESTPAAPSAPAEASRVVSPHSQPPGRQPLDAKREQDAKAAAKKTGSEPAPGAPAPPSSVTTDRSVPVEIAALGAKSDARPQAGVAEYAPIRSENLPPDHFTQAKDVPGGLVGGVAGGVLGDTRMAPRVAAIQKSAAFGLAQTAPAPRDAILEAGMQKDEADAARRKKVGDRSFRFASGYWVDEQCSKGPGRTIVETGEGAPEFEEILGQYPDLRALRPVIILWKERILVLK